MMDRNSYSAETRLKAVNMYMASASISQISRALSIPQETIRSWVNGRRESGRASESTPAKLKAEVDKMSERKITSVIRQGIGESMELTSGLLVRALKERADDPRPVSLAEACILATIASRLMTGLKVCPPLKSAAMEEFEDPS